MKNKNIESLRANKAVKDFAFIALIVILCITILEITKPFDSFSGRLFLQNIWKIGEITIIFFLLVICLIVFSFRRWYEFRIEVRKSRDFEKRMHKSRAELQAVLDGVPDMIMQVDNNIRILWANKAVLERKPNAIGQLSRDVFSGFGESVIETYCKWAMVTGIIEKGIKYQPTMFGNDGGSYWEGIGIPLKSKDGTIYGAIAIARDVTERMRLEHTSNLLASIVESTDDAIFGMTYDSTVLSWNLGAENTYGYMSGEILGRPGFHTVPAEDREFFLHKIEKVIRSQEIERFETRRLRKNGKEIVVSTTLCPFVDATGKKIGVSAIDRDITQRKMAEKALIESESRYRELFENMSSGVTVYEAVNNGDDFIFKDFNHGAEKIENIKREDFVGKRASVIFKRFNVTGLMEMLKNVFSTGQPQQQLLTMKEGNKIISWRDNRVYKLPGFELVSIFDDITERIQAEEALLESEEKFRTLVNTAPDGIVLINNSGKIIEGNLAFAEIFGHTRNDIIEKQFTDFFSDVIAKDRAIKIISEGIEEADILQKEISTISHSGNEIHIELSVARLNDELGSKTGMIAITRDISLRKKYEYDLQDSKEQLRSLAIHLQTAREEERKNIAFEIHDELGYALTALKLDLAWMVKKLNLKDSNLLSKSKTMAELIDTTINKVRSISTQLRPSILDHFGLIAAIEWQANEFQKRTAIRCKLDIEPKDLQFKDPYSTAMFRIFQETLTNIARHAKASRVDVSFYKIDGIIELRISDNGVGMAKEQLTNHKSLGLIGIRERANSLGGHVEFISENGLGTTVVLTVPVKEILREN